MNPAGSGFYPSGHQILFWPRVGLEMSSRNQSLKMDLQKSACCLILLWLNWDSSCKTKSSVFFSLLFLHERRLPLSCTAWNQGRCDINTFLSIRAGSILGYMHPNSTIPKTSEVPRLTQGLQSLLAGCLSNWFWTPGHFRHWGWNMRGLIFLSLGQIIPFWCRAGLNAPSISARRMLPCVVFHNNSTEFWCKVPHILYSVSPKHTDPRSAWCWQEME